MLITFEGGEGAGKTTLIQQLVKELSAKGYNLVQTREPGGSKLSEQIRSWLLNHDFDVKVGNEAELLLFLAARAQHLEELIVPSLAQEKIVLCDRFNDSTIVYQGLARGIGFEKVQKLCELVCSNIQPFLTFLLDVDPKIGLERTQKTSKENASHGEMDRIESEGLDFHTLVRNGFLRLAEENKKRIVVIDANQSKDKVFAQTLEIIKGQFP